MIKRILIMTFIVCNFYFANAQNVGIGTTTPAGKLHIKGSADTSQLVIDASNIQDNTRPLIRLRNAAGRDIMHINTDDSSNVFLGVNAGRLNGGAFNGATDNTFIGYSAGYSCPFGMENTAIGSHSLYSIHVGLYNTAMGARALYNNTDGSSNTGIGVYTLFYNTTGNYNAGDGVYALEFNTTGSFNTANGYAALRSNTFGNYNTASGYQALSATTASDYNTAVGYNAGTGYDNGYNNVFLGANVAANGAGYYNVIGIGQGTVCTGSSQVTVGNGATGSYRAYANWSNISDGRFKTNIQQNVPGLDFINQLRPVTYNLNATALDAFLHKNNSGTAQSVDNRTGSSNNKNITAPANDAAAKAVYSKALQEKETTVYTGFVAQEVEATAKKMGFNFSGIDAPKNENDVYGLRYSEFVVPLVKAVQELNNNNKTQQRQIDDLKSIDKNLQQQIDELKALIKK